MSIGPQVGERFGQLTVLKLLGKQSCGKEQRDCARVVCDCGTEKAVQCRLLKSGRTRSCGCLVSSTCAVRNSTTSETLKAGDRFGRLTVLEILGLQPFGTYSKEMVRVRCECGTEKVLRTASLKNGHILSCGCLRRDSYSRRASYEPSLPKPGEKFGKLTVLENLGTQRTGNVSRNCVRVRCECGTEKVIQSKLLKTGQTKSCGCLGASGNSGRTHSGSGTRLHRIWNLMRYRCENPNNKDFDLYGGSGVSVCPQWHDFAAFRQWAESNGYDEALTIDRKNNAGNYEPTNCRWTTRAQQSRNTRRNVNLTAFGETKTVADWAQDPRCSVTKTSLMERVRKGMPHEEAITRPPHCGLPLTT